MREHWMQSPFSEEHEQYRRSLRRFLDAELEPNIEKYVEAGGHDATLWRKAGEAGLLGVTIPEEYGGPGGDKLFNIIQSDEMGRSLGGATVGSSITSDLATSLLVDYGTHDQKVKWCPGILAGETIQAFAVTEPHSGSDFTSMKTRAVRQGDEWVVNGSKTFISNVTKAGLIYLFAKTNATDRVTCFLLDAKSAGIARAKLKSMGQPAGNVGELFLENVRIPDGAVLGAENEGLKVAFNTFAVDRLCIAARALAEAELAFRLTLEFVRTRESFGHKIVEYQNTQFKLAEMKTALEVARAFHDRCIWDYREGRLELARSAMVKLHSAQTACRVVDDCVQLHGGAGWMDASPVSRIYTSLRLSRIYAGTDEMQKIAIARSL
jgi:alkylation response protein AidB-like acyl-CoA dehydrogenase